MPNKKLSVYIIVHFGKIRRGTNRNFAKGEFQH
ncbi:unnamed protein product, partial [marine sediment metagenome]